MLGLRDHAVLAGVPIITAGPSVPTKSATGATIAWQTDFPADSRLDYGTTIAYGQRVIDPILTKAHRITLTRSHGLVPSTTYHYRVRSVNSDGARASTDRTFTTCPTTRPHYCAGTGCVDPQTDEWHCGGCDTRCGPGKTCCNGACVDTAINGNHCGGCNRPCKSTFCVARTCRAGACVEDRTPGCCETKADCADGNLCTDDRCNTSTHRCAPRATDCNDRVACTDDRCDPAVGCVHTPNDANCPANQFCHPQTGCTCRPAHVCRSRCYGVNSIGEDYSYACDVCCPTDTTCTQDLGSTGVCCPTCPEGTACTYADDDYYVYAICCPIGRVCRSSPSGGSLGCCPPDTTCTAGIDPSGGRVCCPACPDGTTCAKDARSHQVVCCPSAQTCRLFPGDAQQERLACCAAGQGCSPNGGGCVAA